MKIKYSSGIVSRLLYKLVGQEPHIKYSGSKQAWGDNYKAKHPKMYHLTEVILQDIRLFVERQLSLPFRLETYIINRFVDKQHVLQTKLEVGKWHEVSDRMLHANFETLATYVESSCAYVYDDELPGIRGYINRFRVVRNREAGLANLRSRIELESGLSKKLQKENEIIELYLWWRDIRPNRECYVEESGMSKFDIEMRIKYNFQHKFMPFQMSTADSEERDRISERMTRLSEAQELEDDIMLVRLMKIRHYLWT